MRSISSSLVAVIALLILNSSCQPDYSDVFIDLSPFPFHKPDIKQLMGEKNVTLQSRVVEEIRMKSSLQYIQLDKISMRFGMQSFDGLEVVQFCLKNPRDYGIQRIKTLFPLPNQEDKYSEMAFPQEKCLTFSSYKKGLLEAMEPHVQRYMRQPLFANLGAVLSSGVWRFEGMFTVDLQFVMLLRNAKLQRTNRNKHLNPSISFYFTTDTHVRTLETSRFRPQISELVEIKQFERNVKRNGFHAESQYKFQIQKKNVVSMEYQSIPLDLQQCRLVILEGLQSIQYISLSELKAKDICLQNFFSDEIDIESNQKDATQYILGFEVSIEDIKSQSTDVLKGSFKIPMHFRYPIPKSSQVNQGYSNFSLNPSLLFLSCSDLQMKHSEKTLRNDKITEVERLAYMFEKTSFMSKLIFLRSQSVFEYIGISNDPEKTSQITLPHVVTEHSEMGFPLTIFMYAILGLSFCYIIYYTFNRLLGQKKQEKKPENEGKKTQKKKKD